MPTPATTALNSRASRQGDAKARPSQSKSIPAPIRPADLQTRVVETIQRLQNFHQSLEVAGGTYTTKRLQRLSEKLTAIHDQSKHLPRFQEAVHARGRLAELESERTPENYLPLPMATPVGVVSNKLGRLQALVEATADLRTAGGNLSADAVAVAFGISLSQLAGWLGRTRQALSKTPDADSLQDDLAAFEQVARLRIMLAPNTFHKWLRMPDGQLSGAKPIDLLATKQRRTIIARLVEDMLIGTPS